MKCTNGANPANQALQRATWDKAIKRTMGNQRGKCTIYTAIASLGLMALSSQAAAQITLTAESVSVQAGQKAAVPVTINLGSANLQLFAVTFTVVPKAGAPAITGKLTYQAATPPGAPQALNNSLAGRLALGYLNAISPPLVGTMVVGTLMVPIPAGGIAIYEVQLSNINAQDASGHPLTVVGHGGTIEVSTAPTPTLTVTGTREVGGTPTPTATATIVVADNSLSAGSVSSPAGQAAAVPIAINPGDDDVAFFGATFDVVPQDGAPDITAKLTYQAATPPGPPQLMNNSVIGKLAIGYLADFDPPLAGTVVVGTLIVPIPATATGTYQVEPSRISAGDSSGNKVTLAPQAGTITVLPPVCVGDCSGTQLVAVEDIVTLVNIALGTAQPSACADGIPSSAAVNIALILQAVNNALNGCGG